MPSLQRVYRRALFATEPPGAPHLPVAQSYFYRRTPGHNILLLDHWVVRAAPADQKRPVPANDGASVLAHNMGFDPHRTGVDCFYTATRNGAPLAWKLDVKPEHEPRPTYEGMVPVTRGSYWIISCDKRIIRNHGDVWNPRAMELYAALYVL